MYVRVLQCHTQRSASLRSKFCYVVRLVFLFPPMCASDRFEVRELRAKMPAVLFCTLPQHTEVIEHRDETSGKVHRPVPVKHRRDINDNIPLSVCRCNMVTTNVGSNSSSNNNYWKSKYAPIKTPTLKRPGAVGSGPVVLYTSNKQQSTRHAPPLALPRRASSRSIIASVSSVCPCPSRALCTVVHAVALVILRCRLSFAFSCIDP